MFRPGEYVKVDPSQTFWPKGVKGGFISNPIERSVSVGGHVMYRVVPFGSSEGIFVVKHKIFKYPKEFTGEVEFDIYV